MPTVTRISPQKDKTRFNIFIDEQFAYGISVVNLVKYGFKIGSPVSPEVTKRILKEEVLAKYLDLSNRFLSVRPRSQKELEDYLSRKISLKEKVKFSEARQSPVVASVVKTLKKYGYINDKDFAHWYFNSRLKSNPKSIMLIKLELKRKGIGSDILESLKAQKNQDEKSAIKLIEKKQQRWQKLKPLEYKKKFYTYLYSRGFSYETINSAFAFFKQKH